MLFSFKGFVTVNDKFFLRFVNSHSYYAIIVDVVPNLVGIIMELKAEQVSSIENMKTCLKPKRFELPNIENFTLEVNQKSIREYADTICKGFPKKSITFGHNNGIYVHYPIYDFSEEKRKIFYSVLTDMFEFINNDLYNSFIVRNVALPLYCCRKNTLEIDVEVNENEVKKAIEFCIKRGFDASAVSKNSFCISYSAFPCGAYEIRKQKVVKFKNSFIDENHNLIYPFYPLFDLENILNIEEADINIPYYTSHKKVASITSRCFINDKQGVIHILKGYYPEFSKDLEVASKVLHKVLKNGAFLEKLISDDYFVPEIFYIDDTRDNRARKFRYILSINLSEYCSIFSFEKVKEILEDELRKLRFNFEFQDEVLCISDNITVPK